MNFLKNKNDRRDFTKENPGFNFSPGLFPVLIKQTLIINPLRMSEIETLEGVFHSILLDFPPYPSSKPCKDQKRFVCVDKIDTRKKDSRSNNRLRG